MKEISLQTKSGRRTSLMWLRWHLFLKNSKSYIVHFLHFFLSFIQCSLILLRKTCTQSGIRKICTNHFGRKCFSYIYPQVTTTVEDNEAPSRDNPDNNPDDQAETIMTELLWYLEMSLSSQYLSNNHSLHYFSWHSAFTFLSLIRFNSQYVKWRVHCQILSSGKNIIAQQILGDLVTL